MVEPGEETPQEKELSKENKRWKDYAGALLIAIPVLLAALVISQQRTIDSIVSAIAGIAGIILVVLWYGRDSNIRRFTPSRKYPTMLYYASICIGAQCTFLGLTILGIT